MYRVLLPLDDTMNRARKQAQYVASLPCANEAVEAVIAHAMTSEERDVPDAMRRVERLDTVREAIDVLEERGVKHDTLELSTPPSEGILSVAENQNVDEIVMGGRNRSPAEKAILGSVTQTVILNADVPVVVVGGK